MATPLQKVLRTNHGKTFTAAFSTATTAGSLLICHVFNGNATSGHGFVPTTPAGWTLADSVTNGGGGNYLYFKATAASLTNVPLTTTTTTTQLYWTVVLSEWAGYKTLDVHSHTSVTPANATCTLTATGAAAATELIIVGAGNSLGGTPKTYTCTGYTLVTAEKNGNTWFVAAQFYKVSTASGTQTASMVATTSTVQGGVIAVFKKKTGGTGVTATAGVASTTATAHNPGPTVIGHAVASATLASGKNAKVGVATAAVSSTTATAHNPSVAITGNATATATHAATTASAHNASVTISGVAAASSASPRTRTTQRRQQQSPLTHVGDLVECIFHTEPSAGTDHVTSVTDTNGRITWTTSAKVIGTQAQLSGNRMEIWYGIVNSTGSTKIEAHWSGTTFDEFVFTSVWGPPSGITHPTWSFVSGTHISATASGHTMHYPTLLSGTPASGQVFFGWIYTNTATGTVGSAGQLQGSPGAWTPMPTSWSGTVISPTPPTTGRTPNRHRSTSTTTGLRPSSRSSQLQVGGQTPQPPGLPHRLRQLPTTRPSRFQAMPSPPRP